MAKQDEGGRIEYLDGLRGLAILMVILYHAFARWPEFYSYGDRFVGVVVLDTQTAGVRLFFLISGFVILKSLRQCQTFWTFAYRRWRRLFPAMLICSIIVFLTSNLFIFRPEGVPQALQLLPGLTLTGARADGNPFLDQIAVSLGYTGDQIKSLEGSFWSLYVEVKFYVIFGATFYAFGEFWAINNIVLLFFLSILLNKSFYYLQYHDVGRIASIQPFVEVARSFASALRADQYGWFAAGALFYESIASSKIRKKFFLAACIATLSAYFSYGATAANFAIVVVFAFTLQSDYLKRSFANPILLFFGFVSYPLYLLHENMMVSMIKSVGDTTPSLPAILVPAIPIAVVALVAFIVAKYLEPLASAWIPRRASKAAQVPKDD